ncbi:MAG: HRDC domain-containing protein, partial [Kiritimatiellae bacterium]|nr:HRDC domain-containing protein [Kiritimatiellia bacterium]
PRTLGYLSTVSGVGETKLDRYGKEIIELVRSYESE